MSKEIDWSKAPQGTTHWDPVDRNHLKQDGKASKWWSIQRGWEASPWQYPEDLSSMERLIARPVWNGEGLPPVGTVCEFKFYECNPWEEGLILCIGERTIFIRQLNILGEVFEAALRIDALEFRPVKTAEQIAAEERENAIRKLLAETNWILDRNSCEAVIAAGYRKCSE